MFCTSAIVTHVIRPNDESGELEKIRFETPVQKNQRQSSIRSQRRLPRHSQMDRQKGRLRKLIKQNDELATIIRNAYRTADTNGDGIIQKEEFRLLCESLNLQTIKRSKDPRFFDNLWTLLDVNGDDSMDVREFE